MLWLGVAGASQSAAAWAAALSHPQLGAMIARTLGLALIVAAGALAVSIPAAWLLHAYRFPGRRALGVLLALPLAVPSYVSALVVRALLGPAARPRALLADVGIELPPIEGIFGAALALGFLYPLALLPIRAALATADLGAYEAARALGRGPIGAFLAAVLPALRPAAAAGALVIMLYTVGDFGAVSLLRYPTLSYAAYLRYSSPFGRADAIVFSLLLAAIAVGLWVFAHLAAGRAARPVSRRARGAVRLGLGRSAWAWVFCAAILAPCLGLPLAALLGWLVNGIARGLTIPLPWREAIATAGLSAAAASGVVVLAVPIGVARRAGPLWASRLSGALCGIGYALPGIAVALSVVFGAVRALPSLYQTVWLLALVYAARFLPLGAAGLGADLGAQPSSIDEAARALGVPASRVWWRVTLPGALPAARAAWLVAFIAATKELPIALLLRPPGLETLATRVWSWTSEAYFAAASLPALALSLIAAVALARPGGERAGGAR